MDVGRDYLGACQEAGEKKTKVPADGWRVGWGLDGIWRP